MHKVHRVPRFAINVTAVTPVQLFSLYHFKENRWQRVAKCAWPFDLAKYIFHDRIIDDVMNNVRVDLRAVDYDSDPLEAK